MFLYYFDKIFSFSRKHSFTHEEHVASPFTFKYNFDLNFWKYPRIYTNTRKIILALSLFRTFRNSTNWNQTWRPVHCLYRNVPFKTQSYLLHINLSTHKTKPMTLLNSCSRIPLLQLVALLEVGTAIISVILLHLSQTNTLFLPKYCYQTMHCCLVRYYLCRMLITECFTNSRKRFRCEVMFDNKHMSCS